MKRIRKLSNTSLSHPKCHKNAFIMIPISYVLTAYYDLIASSHPLYRVCFYSMFIIKIIIIVVCILLVSGTLICVIVKPEYLMEKCNLEN